MNMPSGDPVLTIECPPSFRFRSTLLSHGWIELAPFSHDEEYTRLRRIESLPDGRIVRLAFTVDRDEDGAGPCGERLHVHIEETLGHGSGAAKHAANASLSPTVHAHLQEVARRIFNLDMDLDPFYALLASVPRYAWVFAHRAGRLLRAPTVWEDLAKTLLTTNTTWAMTRQMTQRLNELGHAGAFPSPETIANLSIDALADHVRAGYRNAYLHELACRIAEARVDVEGWVSTEMSSADLFAEIRSLSGFGPYAAGAVMKLLGRFDYLALDSAARSMFARKFGGGTDTDIRRHYAPYGSWQGLAVWMDVMQDWFLQNSVPEAALNTST